jgi:hypothetical protein
MAPMLGPVKVPHHEGKVPGALKSTRLAAIELEVVWDGLVPGSRRGHRPARYSDLSPAAAKAAEKWEATIGRDRYGAYGYELNMAPAGGSVFVRQAKDYEKAFALDGVYLTDQCGGHVHTDARDFCIDDVCKLLQIYWHVEPAIYAMIPSYRTREVSGRAMPCNKVGDYYMDFGLDKVKGLESAKTFKSKIERGGGGYMDRHCGLNLNAWFKHGTIEWRMPPAMLRAGEMVAWVRLFTRLMNAAKDARFFRLKGLLVEKPTVAAATEKLSEFLDCRLCDEFIQQQQTSRDILWKLIRNKKLADLNGDVEPMAEAA